MAASPTSGEGKNPKILAANFHLEYNDTFHAMGFYRLVYEWLKQKEWADRQTGTAGDNIETFYSEKTSMYGEKELMIWWRVYQWPGIQDFNANSNSFFKYIMDIDFHIIFLKDTQIMERGKKVNTNWGNLQVNIWSWIEMDYKGEWSSHPMLKFLLNTFRLRIFYRDLIRYKYELYRHTFVLHSEMKRFLNLKGTLPQKAGVPFHPTIGGPNEF